MGDQALAGSHDFADMDASGVTAERWRIVFISGMGFFNDGCDLFIISVVMAILKAEWHPSAVAVGLVASTALPASAIGAVLFGRVADRVGRKRLRGVDVRVSAAGAVASAFSPDVWWLIGFRVILGVGIGGDYPVSATLMSEFAGKGSRGRMVSLVYAMQAAGLVVGPLLAAALLATSLNHDLVWRILLAAGAVTALAVYGLRRRMAERPRFAKAAGSRKEKIGFVEGFRALTRRRDLAVRLAGASLAWFTMDFGYYGNTVSAPLVIHAVAPGDALITETLVQLAVFAIAAVPEYLVAAAMMDRMGRKSIQILGFAMMALCFLAIALIPGIEQLVYPFLVIYGISYFFTEFGPNATTFVYPAELFPVEARTTGHGIASAAGKVGGFIGVFLFPTLLSAGGLFAAELAASAVSLVGLAVTVSMLPESLTQKPNSARAA